MNLLRSQPHQGRKLVREAEEVFSQTEYSPAAYMEQEFPFTPGNESADPKISERLELATLIGGTVIVSLFELNYMGSQFINAVKSLH